MISPMLYIRCVLAARREVDEVSIVANAHRIVNFRRGWWIMGSWLRWAILSIF